MEQDIDQAVLDKLNKEDSASYEPTEQEGGANTESSPKNVTEEDVAKIDAESSVKDDIKVKEPVSEPQDAEDVQEIKKSLESYKRRVEDNRSFAMSVKSSIALAQKKIAEMVENGDLDEDASSALLDTLNYDKAREPEWLHQSAQKTESNNIFSVLHEVLTTEIKNQYLDVTEDANFHRKILAFDHLTADASADEKKQIMERLLSDKPTPMTLLKRVLKEGDAFLSDGYSDYLDKGGFKNFISSANKEKEELMKKIDKLEKRLNNYENTYDRSHVDMASSSGLLPGDRGRSSFADMDEAVLARLDREDRRKMTIPY